jgi:thiol-disulfide isomerase/thioredoxin
MKNRKVVFLKSLAISAFLSLLWIINGCSTKIVNQAEEFGSIFVESSIPGAKIILDNLDTGKQTPDTLFNIKVGSHLVKVEMEGYLPSPNSIMMEVKIDTTVQASFTLLSLSYGSLSVSSNVQGAHIVIDNVSTGEQTPFLFDHSVAAGSHIVSVFKDGYSNDPPAKDVVTISTGDTVTLTFNITPTSVGKNAGDITPDFNLEDDFGEWYRLYAHRGFVCMINFWALSCYYCLVELPYLQELYSEYASDSLKILGINYEDDFDIIEQKRNELGLTFFLLKGVESTVKSDLEITGTPVTIILDRSGKIHYYKLGFSDQPDRIQQQMSIFRQKLNELFGR